MRQRAAVPAGLALPVAALCVAARGRGCAMSLRQPWTRDRRAQSARYQRQPCAPVRQPRALCTGAYLCFISEQIAGRHAETLPARMVFAQADFFPRVATALWQPECAARMADAPTSHFASLGNYMPLGERLDRWPPRRPKPTQLSSWWREPGNGTITGTGGHGPRWRKQRDGGAPLEAADACLRQLLSDFGRALPDAHWPACAPQTQSRRCQEAKLTVYRNNNFIVSRHRLLQAAPARVYRELTRRFVGDGLCLKNGVGLGRDRNRNLVSVRDSPGYSKVTVGLVSELLADVLWGNRPVHLAPVLALPRDMGECLAV